MNPLLVGPQVLGGVEGVAAQVAEEILRPYHNLSRLNLAGFLYTLTRSLGSFMPRRMGHPVPTKGSQVSSKMAPSLAMDGEETDDINR